MFISIHIDGEETKNTHSGMSLIIPGNDNVYLNQSKLLGSDMLESFKSNYQLSVPSEYIQRDKGIYVLNANPSPSILIEVGFLTTKKDFDYLVKQKNQEIIAKNILNGIEKYAQQSVPADPKSLANEKVSAFITDSIPQFYKGKKMKGAHGSQKLNKAIILYEDGSSDTISITEAERLRIIPPPPPPPPPHGFALQDLQSNGLFLINGNYVSKAVVDKIDPKDIEKIDILKGQSAIKKYGEKGKNGVIEITMKENSITINATDPISVKDITVVVDGKKTQPLIIIDNKEVSQDEMNKLDPNRIGSVYVLQGESAIKKYGDKGKYGVIEILKKSDTLPPVTEPAAIKSDKVLQNLKHLHNFQVAILLGLNTSLKPSKTKLIPY